MRERQEEHGAVMGVAAIAGVAASLGRHLEDDGAESGDAERPEAGLDAVADEPQVRSADGISPGVEIVEHEHAADRHGADGTRSAGGGT
jgi:hypothetical protein